MKLSTLLLMVIIQYSVSVRLLKMTCHAKCDVTVFPPYHSKNVALMIVRVFCNIDYVQHLIRCVDCLIKYDIRL